MAMRMRLWWGLFGFYAFMFVVILYLYFCADSSSNKLSGRISRYFMRSVPKPTATFNVTQPCISSEEVSSSENDNPVSINDSLHKALSTKESLSLNFVGCVSAGFHFNEPNRYKKQFVRSIMDKMDAKEDNFPDYLEEDPGPMSLWRFYVTAPPPDKSNIQKRKNNQFYAK